MSYGDGWISRRERFGEQNHVVRYEGWNVAPVEREFFDDTDFGLIAVTNRNNGDVGWRVLMERGLILRQRVGIPNCGIGYPLMARSSMPWQGRNIILTSGLPATEVGS